MGIGRQLEIGRTVQQVAGAVGSSTEGWRFQSQADLADLASWCFLAL